MAEEVISLGFDHDSEIAFDEEILQYLREEWGDSALDEEILREEGDDSACDKTIAEILNADNEGLSELFDSMDAEWMNFEDEEWLLAGARKSEQQGANPLFSVLRQRLGAPRRWQDGTVVQDRLRLQLKQNRVPQDDLLGEAVAEAFYQNVRDYIHHEKLNPPQYKLQIKIHHNGAGHNVWTSSPLLPVTDWMENRERTRQWIQQLTNELNSSQNMDLSKDDFFAELTLVRTPSTGGRYKKYNIKTLSYEDMLLKKRAIIAIRNKDELCCARAIVTLKARLEKDSQYKNLRKGLPIQTRLAKQLHHDANVPEGACGTKELNSFQTYLGSNYQLMVLEGLKGHIMFKNQAYDHAEHVIALLKIKEHHAITSLPAFLNRAYFCRYCERAYNEETAEKHNCKGQNCIACRLNKKRCRNFATFVKPTIHCDHCKRLFYGQDCYEAHKKGKKPVCTRLAKCLECCKVFKRTKQHTCYKTTCKNCGQFKDIQHRCFIQPYSMKKSEEGERFDEEEEEALEEEQNVPGKKEKPLPIVVAFDIECAAQPMEGSEEKVFEPVLIGWSTLGEVEDYQEVATIREFLTAIKAKTNFEGEDRDVYCYAHNLRAFDGLFIQEELYNQGYTIENILNQGAKYLSFRCENLIFRDSMNFFNMALEKLSSTFNLQELHKGFFPYSWISESNEGYVGEFPPAEDYHPERMSEKRRKEFHLWYEQQRGKPFDYNKELSLYLKSDVLVLKGALQAFSAEMFTLTQVEPLTKCVTIASTAFRVWQQNFLEADLIALETQTGWRSNQVNQSMEALEWLSYENAKIGGGIRVSSYFLLFHGKDPALSRKKDNEIISPLEIEQ